MVKDSLPLIRQIDIFDIIRKCTKKPAKESIQVPREGIKNLSLLPIVGYSPANGFVIGAAVSEIEFLGSQSNTQLSTALVNVSITTKDQILLNLGFDLYTPNNKWYISGDNRLLFFSQPTYGLGIYGLNGVLAYKCYLRSSALSGFAGHYPGYL